MLESILNIYVQFMPVMFGLYMFYFYFIGHHTKKVTEFEFLLGTIFATVIVTSIWPLSIILTILTFFIKKEIE